MKVVCRVIFGQPSVCLVSHSDDECREVVVASLFTAFEELGSFQHRCLICEKVRDELSEKLPVLVCNGSLSF